MIKGDADYLKDIASKYVCSEHGTPVVVAWHAQENSYVLRCGHGEYPEEVTRNPSLTEMFKQGTLPEGPIKDRIELRERRKAMQQNKQPKAMTFARVPATDLATGQLLPPGTVEALVAYAKKYELDPYRGHVVVMHGKPYVTLDGYLYHAFMVNIPYKLKSRPLSDEERKTNLIPEGTHAWIAEIDKGWSHTYFMGLGIVTQEEMEAKSPRDQSKLRSPVVAAHPWQLAQKRAEWQALRRAFPIGETEEKKGETGSES